MEQVTQQDLRAALSPSGRPRRRPSLPEPSPDQPPVWDWSAGVSENERAELQALRDEVERLRARDAELTEQAEAAGRRVRALEDALRSLAEAGMWSRRRVVAELRERGLVPAPGR